MDKQLPAGENNSAKAERKNYNLTVNVNVTPVEIAELQSRCDRYEKALKEIASPTLYSLDPWGDIVDNMMRVANEALSGEGEKVKQWWEAAKLPKYIKHKHGWVDEHIGINHAGDCLVFVGLNDTIEWQFSFLSPATEAEYIAYINQKEVK